MAPTRAETASSVESKDSVAKTDRTESTPGMLPRQLRRDDGDNTIDEQDSAFLVSSPGGSSFEFVDAFEHMAEERNTTDIVQDFPPEIAFSIFSYLEAPRELLNASLVSKPWYALAMDNVIWKTAFEAREGWRIRSDANRLLERRECDPQQEPFPYFLPDNECLQRPNWVVRNMSNRSKRPRGFDPEWDDDDLMWKSDLSVMLGPEGQDSSEVSCIGSDTGLTSPSTPARGKQRQVDPDLLEDSPLLARQQTQQGPSVAEAKTHLGRVDWRKIYVARHLLELRWLGKYTKRDGQAWLPPYRYLLGHTDSIYCVVSDECEGKGKKPVAISGSRDHTIMIWDIETKQPLSRWKGHTGSVLCIRIAGDRLLSGSSDGHMLVWDYKAMLSRTEGGSTAQEVDLPIIKKLKHPWSVLDIHFDEKRIVTCCRDGTVRVWSPETYEQILTYKAHHSPVNSGRLCGDQIVTIAGNNTIHVWDVNTGKTARSFMTDEGPACVLFEEGCIIVGTKQPAMLVWDAATGELKQEWQGHEELVRALAFDKQKKIIASAGYDGRVKLWKLGEEKSFMTLQRHQDQVLDVATGVSRIFTVGKEAVVCVRDFGVGLDTSLFA